MKQIGEILQQYDETFLLIKLMIEYDEQERPFLLACYHQLYRCFIETKINCFSKSFFSHAEKGKNEKYEKIIAFDVIENPFSLIKTTVKDFQTCMNLWVPECVLNEYNGDFLVVKSVFETMRSPENMMVSDLSKEEVDKILAVARYVERIMPYDEFEAHRNQKIMNNIIYECKEHFSLPVKTKNWNELLQYDKSVIKRAAETLNFHNRPDDPIRIERSYEAIKDMYEHCITHDKEVFAENKNILVIEDHGEHNAPLIYVDNEQSKKRQLFCEYSGRMEDLFENRVHVKAKNRTNEELVVWICSSACYPIRTKGQKRRDMIELLQRALNARAMKVYGYK